jgi:acyl-coenzyme A synthetase/AMP-(fatty) acid ligase
VSSGRACPILSTRAKPPAAILYGRRAAARFDLAGSFPGKYLTGDGARRDGDGYFWVMGGVDDVVNAAGHRLGTAEIESALVSHARVAEAAVVGRPDELEGRALVAFVTLKSAHRPLPELKGELAEHVANEIGRFAKPDAIRFADALPKTRSGKIMRRFLKDIAAGQPPESDATTLEDLTVLATLSATPKTDARRCGGATATCGGHPAWADAAGPRPPAAATPPWATESCRSLRT